MEEQWLYSKFLTLGSSPCPWGSLSFCPLWWPCSSPCLWGGPSTAPQWSSGSPSIQPPLPPCPCSGSRGPVVVSVLKLEDCHIQSKDYTNDPHCLPASQYSGLDWGGQPWITGCCIVASLLPLKWGAAGWLSRLEVNQQFFDFWLNSFSTKTERCNNRIDCRFCIDQPIDLVPPLSLTRLLELHHLRQEHYKNTKRASHLFFSQGPRSRIWRNWFSVLLPFDFVFFYIQTANIDLWPQDNWRWT